MFLSAIYWLVYPERVNIWYSSFQKFIYKENTQQCISILLLHLSTNWKTTSVIRQKGESQIECFKLTKHAKFSEKRTFLAPLVRTRTCAYQGVRNVLFLENLACFVFLIHPFWDLPFCHITDELFIVSITWFMTLMD